MKIKTILAAFVLILPLMPNSAVAGSIETWICLHNTTSVRKLILVEDIYNNDWDGVSRPDHNWHGTYVEANQTRCERAEKNDNAKIPKFSFIINGQTSQQKVRMSYAEAYLAKAAGWAVYIGYDPSSVILRGVKNARYQSLEKYEVGDDCNAGAYCKLFTIENVP